MGIKTKIGEHDFHKPPCSSYCKMLGVYCPYVAQGVTNVNNVLRWADIQDGKTTGVTVTFQSKKDESDQFSTIGTEVKQGQYTCWGDGSGFEYDLMSRNVMGPGGPTESVYDISSYGVNHNPLNVTNCTWNAWVDKYQYDYRFGRVSDTNGETILFPNVDNPWMFTEYVFKGIGPGAKLDHWGEKQVPEIGKYYVVEPPLFDEDTLQLVNYDSTLETLTSFDGKYSEQPYIELWDGGGTSNDESNSYSSENDDEYSGSNSDSESDSESRSGSTSESLEFLGYGVKQHRKIEDWDVLRNTYDADSYPCKDAGVLLYRASLPVQCIKWGEHGNIPPHTLDMTAPENWLDAGAITTAIKAVYKAHLGSSFYAERDGYYYWGGDTPGQQGRQAYVIESVSYTKVSIGGITSYYEYQQQTSGGTAVDMPTEQLSGVYKLMKPTEKVRGYGSQGEEICHAGCANCQGKGGYLRCVALDNETDQELKTKIANFFSPTKCLVANGFNSCPSKQHPSVNGRPVLATYETSKTQTRQWGGDVWLMGYGLGLAVAGGAVGGVAGVGAVALGASMLMAGILDTYIDLRRRGSATISYEISYEPVSASTERPKLNKEKYNEFGQGVQIVPGTGKFAFDSKQNADVFKGGDTNVFNDINTLSFHRLFRSVMHCATQSNCNEFMGASQQQGYNPYYKCGGDGKCRYYKKSNGGVTGCPYNCVSKRAVEFCNVAAAMSKSLPTYAQSYNDLTVGGVWHKNHKTIFSDFDIDYKKKDGWLIVAPDDENSFAYRQVKENVCLLAVKGSATQCSGDYGGCALISPDSSLKCPSGYVLLAKFSTTHRKQKYSTLSGYVDENYKRKKDEGDIVYKFNVYEVVDVFYWFHPVDNDGSDLTSASVLPLLKQHLTKSGNNWFCKVEKNFKVPQYNSIMVDNDCKFIGGWHPEYKDYSKIGGEFMQDIVSDAEREGQGMGDYVKGQDYTPMPQTVNKKGYWIDQSGEYIVDERSTGIEEPIASDDAREEASGNGNAVCISFKKSNTEIDGETGKQIKPKTTNGAVFSNDPYDLVVTTFRAAKHKENGVQKGRPMFRDPETDNEYLAPLIMNNPDLLPTVRTCLHCPTCGYYMAFRYYGNNCPWCGSKLELVTGDIGEDMEAGDLWDERSNSSSDSSSASVMRNFLKLYSIGNVDVWAPPGTCLRTDAYYWKQQNVITNGLKRQIYYRLGDSNKESGGAAFKFNKMNAQAETTLGYPESIGFFKQIPPDQQTSLEDKRYTKKYIDWQDTNKSEYDGQYNGIMPRHLLPGLYPEGENGGEDEGVIAPFTSSSSDALKLVTYEQIKALRNFVEPCYAYTLDSYTGEYPTYRASYQQREKVDQPIIYKGRRCVLKPVVLASTDDGRDSYQTYFSGDLVYGNVKEYFPSGYTWWHLKNVIGGRCTDNKGGMYHIDDGGKDGKGRMVGGSGGEYTCGSMTISKCALSIYGVLPLDKDIVAAYVITSSAGISASKNPIGRSWTGGPVMYCHYHAFPVKHNAPSWGLYNDDGFVRHLHGTAGYPDGQWFDENGDGPHDANWRPPNDAEIAPQDYSMQRHWGANSEDVEEDRNMYYESNFAKTMQNLPGIRDVSFYRNVGTPKENVFEYGSATKLVGSGYNASSFGDAAGFMGYHIQNTSEKREQKYHYICLNENNDIVQVCPDSIIWKQKTEEEIKQEILNHTAEVTFEVTDGTEEGTVSYKFYQTDSELYQNVVPQQSQAITNYFDMSWANTKGYVENLYEVDEGKPSEWTSPVIFQDGEQEPEEYAKLELTGQVGDVPRVIPVTEIVQRLYNKRIERQFDCKAGATFDTVKNWSFYYPVVDGTLKKLDSDVALQNFSIKDSNNYILLNDCDTYPKLENEGEVPTISADGDKYELAEKTCEIVANVMLGAVVTTYNCNYLINGKQGALKIGETIENGMDCVSTLFGGATIKEITDSTFVITSKGSISIDDIANNCYGIVGVTPGTYSIGQNRVVGVTSNTIGNHPSKLQESNGAWCFSTYSKRTQSFTMDLLRAPLCISQRDYRYEQASADYSNCKCPTTNCKAHTQRCAVAANNCNKNFNPSQPTCPWGHSLEGASGVIQKKGDGIMTYEYDKPFSPDPFIRRIVITPISGCSYRVMIRANSQQAWKTLVSVHYANGLYYRLYPTFSDVGQSNPFTNFSFSNNAARARYIKVEVDGVVSSVNHSYIVKSASKYQVVVSGDFSNMEGFSASGSEAYISTANISSAIVSTSIIDNNTMRITLSHDLTGYNVVGSTISFSVKKQVGGISQFEVYGVHYKTEQGSQLENPSANDKYLTITDFEEVYTTQLSTSQSRYKLPNVPTQILEVSIGVDDSCGVNLTPSASSDIYWTTKECEYDSTNGKVKYNKIVGGSYYYDVNSKTIVIPRKNLSGQDWSGYWDNIPIEETVGYKFNSITIRYWSGNGKEITFEATANGHGPSFMVEKNAIRCIRKATLDALPSNGTSCQMIDVNGKKGTKSIPWYCYNNEPATLSIEDSSKSNYTQGVANWSAGEFRLPSFSGAELGNKIDDDDAFIKLFGENAENCYGKCKTTVTFTGAPNQILSGDLHVYAPEKVEKQIQIDASSNPITINERTGGIKNGFIIVKCYPSSPGNGRVTLTYSVPTLLIYARERDLDDPLGSVE